MEITDNFIRSVKEAASGKAIESALIPSVAEAVARWPWFTTARLLRRAASGVYDPLLKLHLQAYPAPGFMLESISPGELGIGFADQPRDTRPGDSEDIIDKFLSHGEYRIVLDDDTTDEDAAAGSSDFDLPDEMISEQLAGIYRAQGLNHRAKEIYRRLCLLNPEKSIYFASIIDEINADGKL